MYLGDTGTFGLNRVGYELLGNAVAEVYLGHGTRVVAEILRSGGLRIRDEGEGIAADFASPSDGAHALERLCLYRGARTDFRPWPRRFLFGLGLPAAAAVSRRFVVEVRRAGYLWRQTFARAAVVSPLRRVRAAGKTGTTVTFWPDPDIFSCVDFSFVQLRRQVEEMALSLPRLRVRLVDRRVDPVLVSSVQVPDGPLTGLQWITAGLAPVHAPVLSGSAEEGGARIALAFRWHRTSAHRFWGVANGETVPEGGTHETGFRTGLTRAIRQAMPDLRQVPGPRGRRSPSGPDMLFGLFAVMTVDHPDLLYMNALASRLGNEELGPMAARLTERLVEEFVRGHPDEARAVAEHLRAPPAVDPKTGRVITPR